MKLKSIVLALLLLVLAACSAKVSTTVFIADLEELRNSAASVIAVEIGLYVSSLDDCGEHRQRHEAIFDRVSAFNAIQFVRCYSEGSSDYARYRLDVPLRYADPYNTAVNAAIEIVRHDDRETGYKGLYLRTKPSDFCELDKLIRAKYFQSANFAETSPLITLTNDLRETRKFVARQVFVDGQPYVNWRTFELDRRDSIKIELSDVTSAWLFDKSCNARPRVALIGHWKPL